MTLMSGNVALPFEGFDIDPRQDVFAQEEHLSIPVVSQRYEGTSFGLSRESHGSRIPLINSALRVGKGRVRTVSASGYRPFDDWRSTSNLSSQRYNLMGLADRGCETDAPGGPGASEYWFQQPTTRKRNSNFSSRPIFQRSHRTWNEQFQSPGHVASPLLSPIQPLASLGESLDIRMREPADQTTSNAFPIQTNRKNYARFGRGPGLNDHFSVQQSAMMIRCVPCNLVFHDSQSCAEHKTSSLHRHLVEEGRIKGINTVEFEFMMGEDERELEVKSSMDPACMEHVNHGNPHLDAPLLSTRSNDNGQEYNGVPLADQFESSQGGPSTPQPSGVVTSHGEYYTTGFVDTAVRSKVGTNVTTRLGSAPASISDLPITPHSPPHTPTVGDLRNYLQRGYQQRVPVPDAALPRTTPPLPPYAHLPPSHSQLSPSHVPDRYLPPNHPPSLRQQHFDPHPLHRHPAPHPLHRHPAPHPLHRHPAPHPLHRHPAPRPPQIRAKLSPPRRKQSWKKQPKATSRVQPLPPPQLQTKPSNGSDKKVQMKVPVTCICELCDRKFNSVAALRNHVKSNVHVKAIEESAKAIQVQYNEDEECDVVQVFRICIEKKKIWNYAYFKSVDGLVSDAPHSKFRFVCPVCTVEYNRDSLPDAKTHFNGKKHRLKVQVCTDQRNEMVIEKY